MGRYCHRQRQLALVAMEVDRGLNCQSTTSNSSQPGLTAQSKPSVVAHRHKYSPTEKTGHYKSRREIFILLRHSGGHRRAVPLDIDETRELLANRRRDVASWARKDNNKRVATLDLISRKPGAALAAPCSTSLPTTATHAGVGICVSWEKGMPGIYFLQRNSAV